MPARIAVKSVGSPGDVFAFDTPLRTLTVGAARSTGFECGEGGSSEEQGSEEQHCRWVEVMDCRG